MLDGMEGGLRGGSLSDVRALVRMHAECSPLSLQRRYLAPMPVLSVPMATRLLNPPGGFSIVMERAGALTGIVTVSPQQAALADVGLLVADPWQRQGLGTRLLVAAARDATGTGIETLELTVPPDSPGVLAMVNGAGLRARISITDGLTRIRIPLVASRPLRVASGGDPQAPDAGIPAPGG